MICFDQLLGTKNDRIAKPQTAADRTDADAAFKNLVDTAKTWATKHMDQWEKFRFTTPHGPIYVTISMEAKFPQSFDDADAVIGPR